MTKILFASLLQNPSVLPLPVPSVMVPVATLSPTNEVVEQELQPIDPSASANIKLEVYFIQYPLNKLGYCNEAAINEKANKRNNFAALAMLQSV